MLLKSRKYYYILFFQVFLFYSCKIYSQIGSDQKREYITQKTETTPIIDGVINDEAWNIIKWSGNFSRKDTLLKEYDTKFKIIYDNKYLYVGVRCYDKKPDSIPLFPSPRDNSSNDWVEIDLDTNLDKKTGYALSVSPYGIRTDANIETDENFNDSWHPKWDVATNIDNIGWTAEMRIPFDELEISNQKNQKWGLQVVRKIIRFNDVSNWQIPNVNESYVAQFGILSGLQDIPENIVTPIFYNQGRKISISELKNDINQLKTVLEGIYPSLYWFSSKKEINELFKNSKTSIRSPMTELEFYKLLAPIFSKIGDLHSSLRPSKALDSHIKNTYKILPLGVLVVKDDIFVVQDWTGKNIFKRGDKITMINGISSKELLKEMRNFITSDGYNISYKNDRIRSRFNILLAIILGNKSEYEVTYNTLNQEFKKHKVTAILRKDFKENTIPRTPNKLRDRYRNFHLLDSTTAYLSLRSFNGGDNFRNYIDQTFEKIAQESIKDLIIDLRYSYGGQDWNGSYLYSYLAQSNYLYFKRYETNTSLNKDKLENIDCCISKEDLEFLNIVSSKDEEGIQMVTNYELSGYRDPEQNIRPRKNNRYDNNVYILINGANISTSSDFSSLAKDKKRAVFIGEETGGGYFGNTSGIIQSFVLPNSRLIARINFIKYLNNRERIDATFGRGVFPDHVVIPTQKSIAEGTDIELDYTIKLIKSEKNKTNENNGYK
ncbi:S41 family peptidase [Aquimarina sp. AU474]|uniref:S41 family peptidase n=1 Tax=Aquimarina sp. AU474 TaxID=2108529 RepID=UPI000D685B53|nr:S41 family peptidase [Aquimarina sp. AU474]